MKKIICIILFTVVPILAMAQASGGQITRKKLIVSKNNARSDTPAMRNSITNEQKQSNNQEILPISRERLGRYNIVVCTFSYLSDAQTECKKIRNDSYSSEIFLDSTNKFNVLMFPSANDVYTAKAYRNQARQMYSTAWILCSENGRTYRYDSPEDNNLSTKTKSLSKYNIVAKTCSTLSSAQDECRSISNKGFTSNIYIESSENYRVLIYPSTNSLQDAILFRNKARQVYPAAWIMCLENGRTYRYDTSEEKVIRAWSPSKYNVVAKTCSTLSSAQDECRTISDNGYTSNIYIESPETYRVLIYLSTNSLHDAIQYRNKARQVYPAAWIMCYENGRTFRYD